MRKTTDKYEGGKTTDNDLLKRRCVLSMSAGRTSYRFTVRSKADRLQRQRLQQ